MRVIKLTKENELFCHYDRQTSAQDCYIELDCRGETLSASYNAEIGNAVPFSVYHGHEQRFGIPCLTNEAANNLMEELVPLAERVVAGYESVWNGNNNVARFNEDASKALEEINQTCEAVEGYEEESVQEWGVEDWLYSTVHRIDEDGNSCKWNCCVRTVIDDVGEITGKTTDDELNTMGYKIEEDLDKNVVLTGVSKFLETERENCKENAEDLL